ncbi:MAG: anthranilate phosphoribosyltransferase [Mariprofundaceae bacterium]
MSESKLSITSLIKRVARGKHGSEHLNQDEASKVFCELLKPSADLLQLGAFLIAQRMKGETADELAGFIQASRMHTAHFNQVKAPFGAVDLPCYAGKRRASHAYLAAALQARDEGVKIFIHGVENIEGRVSAWQILEKQGIQRATGLIEADNIMQSDDIVYMDLAEICPDLHRIYQLRSRLGVRSFANTVARLLNPMQCDGQLNGFFHTPYADYMAAANVLLEQPRSLIFMGAEGEPELYADRQKQVRLQEATHITPITFEDCGFEPYPKQAASSLNQILIDFNQLHKNENSRESSTVQRMKNAFLWAAGQASLQHVNILGNNHE